MSNILFGIIPNIETYRNPYKLAGIRADKQVYGNGISFDVCSDQADAVLAEQYAAEKEKILNRLREEFFAALQFWQDELVYKQFRTVSFDDELVFTWVEECFDAIPVFYQFPDHLGTCLDPCGDSLIPPDSARMMIERLTARAARVEADELGELERLIALLRQAVAEDRWAICFGV